MNVSKRVKRASTFQPVNLLQQAGIAARLGDGPGLFQAFAGLVGRQKERHPYPDARSEMARRERVGASERVLEQLAGLFILAALPRHPPQVRRQPCDALRNGEFFCQAQSFGEQTLRRIEIIPGEGDFTGR